MRIAYCFGPPKTCPQGHDSNNNEQPAAAKEAIAVLKGRKIGDGLSVENKDLFYYQYLLEEEMLSNCQIKNSNLAGSALPHRERLS
jgi:hypothetical protein